MFYRIRLDLAFPKEASAKSVSKTALDHLKNALTINPGSVNQENGFIMLEKCYHDEDPSKPCEVIGLWTTPDTP